MRFSKSILIGPILLIWILGSILSAQDYQAQIDALQNKQQELYKQMEEANQAKNTDAYNTALQEFEQVKTELEQLKEKITSQQSTESQAKIAFNEGGKYYKQQMYQEAMNEFNKAIEINPGYEKAYYMKALTLARLNLLDDAELAYLKCIELDPKFYEAKFALGKLYEARGDGKKAIGLYDNVLESDPDNAKAAYSKGAVYLGWGANAEAALAFEKAVKVDSTYDLAYIGWGTALTELGKINDAVDKLKKAIALNSRSDDSYYRLAKAYNSTEDFSGALEAAEKALQIRSRNAAAYIEKGNALEGLGKRNEAKDAFLMAAQTDKRWKEWVNYHIEKMQ